MDKRTIIPSDRGQHAYIRIASDGGVKQRVIPEETVASDTFHEKHWKFKDAADHLAISKSTLKRLTLIELSEGATDIGTVRIGPKKAHTLYTFTDSAVRRIHHRMVGGHYGRPAILAES